jgi:hypothetical protein
VFLSS